MNYFFIVIKRYWFFSIVVVVGLTAVEIFLVCKFGSAPFGKDVRIDTEKMGDLYWSVSYDDENCIDCPKKWKVVKAGLSIPFIFESPSTYELKWVKDQVYPAIEDYQDDYELVLRLMNHIHEKTEYASKKEFKSAKRDYNTYFDLVKAVLNGGKFWCGSISKAMMTACLSLGRNARLIHFQTAPDGDSDYLGHYAVEVWLPELRKWILFDPTINIYYLYKGQPASALEVHKAYVNGKTGDVDVVKEGKLYKLETFNDKYFLPGVSLKNYFQHFQVIFRNDFLENGDIVRTSNRETINYYVNWVDEKTPAFYFKQELPALALRIGILLFNGVIIVLLSVGLLIKKRK